VGNHDQRITQNISTHNQISIEGRGVVDASGMGSDKSATQTVASSQPRWRELNFSYVPTAQKAQETKVVASQPTQAKVEVFEPPKPVLGVFNKDDNLSVQKAAEQGNADAQLTLGQMYAEGRGVAKDEEKAANWYRKAAEQGNARACEHIGDMYRFGNGVAQSHEKSVYWYRRGDELNDAGCQRSLGLCYEDGDGVDQDHEQAAHWYRKAAEQGDPPGQFGLGFKYHFGLGVARDHEKAVYWYRKAAEQGLPLGQNNLGYMYAEGLGVGKDKEKAVYWFRKAAEQGQESAIEALKDLESSDAPTQPPTDGHGAWDYGNYSYTGMFKNGQWNGLGELTWSGNDLGHKYVGNFVNGERTGQGTYYFPDGTTQVGIFENGIYQEPENQIDDADTEEQIIYNDGSSYRGEVENGVPEGFGTMTFTNGDSMYGIFINGIMNDATAHYDFADGGSYDGPMFKTIFIGPGTRTFGGDYVGHSYTGEFENGNFNGQGTYFFPDGSTNVGEFKDGTFVPSKPAKPDYVYVGATSNGIPHGVGKMTWGNGDVYKGDFVNGVRHGLGEFTYANKTQLTGRFENDEFVKNASFAESFKIGYKTGDL
jgi:TPR repeat protein